MITLEEIQRESERFLREQAGAQKCRMATVEEFRDIIARNNLSGKFKTRDFNMGDFILAQMYVRLNGEYVYLTSVAYLEENAS